MEIVSEINNRTFSLLGMNIKREFESNVLLKIISNIQLDINNHIPSHNLCFNICPRNNDFFIIFLSACFNLTRIALP